MCPPHNRVTHTTKKRGSFCARVRASLHTDASLTSLLKGGFNRDSKEGLVTLRYRRANLRSRSGAAFYPSSDKLVPEFAKYDLSRFMNLCRARLNLESVNQKQSKLAPNETAVRGKKRSATGQDS